jgi:hypothetical protein
LLAALCASTGCVTKARARAEARGAYEAGRRDAFRGTDPAGPVPGNPQTAAGQVTFVGAVAIPRVPWRQGLTLAQGILEADYRGAQDPEVIYIVRQGRAIPVPAETLLRGDDVPLEPGDIIQVK